MSINDSRSHASIAREFLARFCDDADLLAMVHHHDEPFSLYRHWHYKHKVRVDRLESLIESIHDWNLFSAFLIIDGSTEGKGREPLAWFFSQIEGRVASSFNAADIIGPATPDTPATGAE